MLRRLFLTDEEKDEMQNSYREPKEVEQKTLTYARRRLGSLSDFTRKTRISWNRQTAAMSCGPFLLDFWSIFHALSSWFHASRISFFLFALPAVTSSWHWCHISVPLQTVLWIDSKHTFTIAGDVTLPPCHSAAATSHSVTSGVILSVGCMQWTIQNLYSNL